MNLVFSLKEITLLVLLITIATSNENTTISNVGSLFPTNDYNNHEVKFDDLKNAEKDLNVGDLFKTFSCTDHKVNCPYVDIKKIIPQNQSCCKNLTKMF